MTAPALLKIDVQGFELEVLRASRPLLGAFEHVYVEASFEVLYAGQALAGDVAAFLRAHGFREARALQREPGAGRKSGTGGFPVSSGYVIRPEHLAGRQVGSPDARRERRGA